MDQDSAPTTALVLGGGGVAGIAWELGLLHGLAEGGVPIGEADLVVGTSAGSMVGALVRFGIAEDAYRQQLAPLPSTYVEPPELDWADVGGALADAMRGASSDEDARGRVGRAAMRVTDGQSGAERAATFRESFPSDDWPAGRLAVTSVDAEDGTFRVFTNGDDVLLADAVAASCSVPFVWSPVEIDGRRYVDGGARSVTNADVAAGYDRVLVVACRPEEPSPTGPDLDRAVESLRATGSDVFVVVADEASQQAYGTNVLATSSREPAARAGAAQGSAVAADVAAFWRR